MLKCRKERNVSGVKEKSKVPQQKRGIRTKQHIIDTAIRLFSEKGYYNTNSNEISEQAGVSIGCFYSYFKDKKQLFLDALAYYYEQINNNIRSKLVIESDEREVIVSQLIRNVFLAHKFLPEFHKEVKALSILDSDVGAFVEKEEKAELEYTYHLLKLWENEIKVDIEIAAFIIYNTIQINAHSLVFSNIPYEEEAIIKALVSMIFKYLF